MQTSKAHTLAKFGGMNFSAELSALIGSTLLSLVLTGVGLIFLSYSLPKALILGLAALTIHWVADLLHQAGHALAARATGYPVTGIRLWGVLSSTIYPPGEPPLPKSTHLRRAIGGPVISLAVSILAANLLPLFRTGSWLWWLDLFFLLDNFLVFTVGALLPLGFTDGCTLLRLNNDQG